MAYPEPKPGLVIHYAYLWQAEAARGLEEGRKDRPCVVILAVQEREGEKIVTVAPITHSPPAADDHAVEMPPMVKQRLGLDDGRSWVVTTELNRFSWPGPDLRPIPRRTPSAYAYGFVPGALVEAVRRQIAARRGVQLVPRST